MTDSTVTLQTLDIRHFFGGGVYAKQTFIQKGLRLTQHIHSHDHLSILVSGSVEVSVDGKRSIHIAPCDPILIEAGKAHEVCSLTDAIWYCLWATDGTDPAAADASVIIAAAPE